jgi:hypothetical protein
MIAAEQRLKDAGYGDKFILAQEDEDNDQVGCEPRTVGCFSYFYFCLHIGYIISENQVCKMHLLFIIYRSLKELANAMFLI